jgi:hypothetical protein
LPSATVGSESSLKPSGIVACHLNRRVFALAIEITVSTEFVPVCAGFMPNCGHEGIN